MRHEHYLMRQAIHNLKVKNVLLEGVRKRGLGVADDTSSNLQVIEMDQFIALFSQQQATYAKIVGEHAEPHEVDAHQLHAMRGREQIKYEKIYNGSCPINKYGTTEHWEGLWQKMVQWKIQSLCDLGTGLGGLPRTLYRETDIKHAVGLDFAMQSSCCQVKTWQDKGEEYALRLMRAPAHKIPFADHTFEYVTAFDMMEHLLPVEVDDVIREMQRCATKGLLFSISYVPSYIKVQGTPLHITIRPRSWWVKALRRVTGWNIGHYNKYIVVTKEPLPDDVVPPIEQFYDRPAPEEVILLGKGPSLDRWDGSETNGRTVMAINEAMTRKDSDIGIYSDEAMRALSPPTTVTVIRPSFLKHSHGDCEQFVYDRAEYGAETCSTASIAIIFLGVWGVKKILAVGFDAYDTPIGPVYADCVSGMISQRSSSDFSFVNETIENAIRDTGIDVEFWHRQLTTKSKESMKA